MVFIYFFDRSIAKPEKNTIPLKGQDFDQEKTFLTAKFQVGSNKSDKLNFSSAQKVFHTGDVPEKVLEVFLLSSRSKGSCYCSCWYQVIDLEGVKS